MSATKRCTKCRLEKPIAEFHLNKRTQKPRSRCKICTNQDNVARQAAQPEKATARTNAWRAANPGRASQIARDWQLRHPEQYREVARRRKYLNLDFNAMWEAQSGLCASCGILMLREGRTPESVCVDHDRACCSGPKSCGKCIRGLIHWRCNMLLGYAKDDLKVLRSAIKYLEAWEASKGRDSSDRPVKHDSPCVPASSTYGGI